MVFGKKLIFLSASFLIFLTSAPVYATVTVSDGSYVRIGYDVGATTDPSIIPSVYRTNVDYQIIQIKDNLSGSLNKYGANAGWMITDNAISGSGNSSLLLKSDSYGWFYQRSHAETTINFKLNNKYYYSAPDNYNKHVTGIPGRSGILNPGDYTIKGETLGESGGYQFLMTLNSFDDVLQNSVSKPEIIDDGNKRYLQAVLQPQWGVSLGDAATLGGYDHFNWVQMIVRDDALQECLLNGGVGCDSVRSKIDNSLPTTLDMYGSIKPYIDAPPGSYRYSQTPNSSFPLYLDETYGFTMSDTKSQLSLSTSKENNKMAFIDDPTTQPFKMKVFITMLAGVKSDGLVEIIDVPGTSFSWSYTGGLNDMYHINHYAPDATSSGSYDFLGYMNLSDLSRDQLQLLINSGVGFSNGLQPVPIPSCIWLFGAGLFGIIGIRRRMKN